MARKPERKPLGLIIFRLPQTYSRLQIKARLILCKKYLLIQETRENSTAITFVKLIADKQNLEQ